MSEASTAPADPAPIFAALADRTRLSLLIRLSTGDTLSIARLSTDAKLTRQAVTKHLHVLENAGLVRSMRSGRETRYSLCSESIATARSFLDDVSAQWDEALGRLRALVED